VGNKNDKQIKKEKRYEAIFAAINGFLGATIWFYGWKFLGYTPRTRCIDPDTVNCIHRPAPTTEPIITIAVLVILPIAIVGIIWLCVRLISGLWRSRR
jgi:hypothetical protein